MKVYKRLMSDYFHKEKIRNWVYFPMTVEKEHKHGELLKARRQIYTFLSQKAHPLKQDRILERTLE